MASLTRRMQRKPLRVAKKYRGAAQPVEVTPTGYRVLRPTKGWLHCASTRVLAQMRMARLLNA